MQFFVIVMAGFGRTLNFKLVLLGDAAVGKSSCVERFVKNEFFEFQQPTIGGLARDSCFPSFLIDVGSIFLL